MTRFAWGAHVQLSRKASIKSVTQTFNKIALMGPFGGGNLGDAATQQAMIQQIRQRCPQAEIYGISHSTGDTERRHGIRSFPIGYVEGSGPGRWSRLLQRLHNHPNPWLRRLERWIKRLPVELGLWLRDYRNLKAIDLLIVSGGGQLDDYWGGAWSHPYTLLKWAILARLRRIRLLFVSVGAGPIDAGLSRWFIKRALSLAHYRSYRDAQSQRLVESIGFHSRSADAVYPDLAHSLKLDAQNAAALPLRRPLVGVGPITYFDPRIWPQSDDAIYKRYLEKLACFLIWLIDQGYGLLFFPGEAVHDRWVIDDLLQLLAQRDITPDGRRLAAPAIETTDTLIAHLAAVDCVVTSRFHGVLLAQLLEKPCVALSYHEKIDVLMDEMGQAAYSLPIGEFSVEQLYERFMSLQANSARVQKQLRSKNQEKRRALEEQYTRIFK